MPADRRAAQPQGWPASAEMPLLIRQTLASSPVCVRAALARTMASLRGLRLTPDCAATVELVLAETLNNVVEHAYGSGPPGPIEMSIWLDRGPAPALFCLICDHGAPMPDGTPPSGRRALLDVPLDDMPEGGFGWFLIRSLTRDLDYVRLAGCNRLSFLVPIEMLPAP